MAEIYVSASSGSDLTGDGSPAQPYATIQKAALVAMPGDTVKIEGGTYPEVVIPPRSGELNAPIIFEGFSGTAIISGADAIAEWQLEENGIYTAALPWSSLGFGNDQLFIDSAMMTESRYPFVGDETRQTRADLLTATAGSGEEKGEGRAQGSISHPELANFESGYWSGGRVNFNGNGEVFQTGTIANHTNDTIEFEFTWFNEDYIPKGDSLFYLWGKQPSVFNEGEFWIDETGKIWFKPPVGQNANDINITAKKRSLAFDLSGKSHIVIRNLKIFAATINTAVEETQPLSAGSGILIDSVEILYPSHYRSLEGNPYVDGTLDTGVRLKGCDNEIKNSLIQFSAGNGVSLGGNNNRVTNCTIFDCNYAGSDAGAIFTDTIFSENRNHAITQNTIRGCGRSGIVHRKCKASSIKYNEITLFGQLCADIGGTYTWGSDQQGTELAYNQISEIAAAKYGVAIYLDNNSENVIVYKNLTVGSVQINGPNVTGHKFYNNTIDGALQFGASPTGLVEIQNNIATLGILTPPAEAIISNNIERFGDPGFESRETGNYQLRSDSPALDAGAFIPPYTDDSARTQPDIGCFGCDLPLWVAGALVRSQDLPQLQGSVKRVRPGIAKVEIQIPGDRKLPSGSQIKLGENETPASEFRQQRGKATFLKVPVAEDANEEVFLKLGTEESWQQITSLTSEVSQLKGRFAAESLLSTQVFSSAVQGTLALIEWDASEAIASGKMQEDGRDINIADRSGNPLPFWLDGNVGSRTLIFVRLPEVPTEKEIQVEISYGHGSESESASNLAEVIPALNSYRNKLWLAANDGVTVTNGNIESVRDRSGNKTGPTSDHTEYGSFVSVSNPQLADGISGFPAFNFTGSEGLDIGQNFILNADQPRTFFAVQSYSQEDWNNCIWSIGYPGSADLGGYVGNDEARLTLGQWDGDGFASIQTPLGSVPRNRINLITAIAHNDSTEVRVQGNQILIDPQKLHHYEINGEFYLGRKRSDESSRWYKGFLYEFIAFSEALNVDQIAEIEEYFSLKYQIAFQ